MLEPILASIKILITEMEKATNTSGEGEKLSTHNKKLATYLGALGVEIAAIEHEARTLKDNYDRLKAQKFLAAVQMPVEKAKMVALTDEQVQGSLKALRGVETTLDELKAKSRSYWAYLDNSRSRLSWVKGDRNA